MLALFFFFFSLTFTELKEIGMKRVVYGAHVLSLSFFFFVTLAKIACCRRLATHGPLGRGF